MAWHYDLYGWFDGEVPDGSDRSTDVAPPEIDDPAQRANWTGHKWLLVDYVEPPKEESRLEIMPPIKSDGQFAPAFLAAIQAALADGIISADDLSGLISGMAQVDLVSSERVI